MTYLYVHTAPNGKRYVGIADNCEARWEVGGRGYADNEAFYKDIPVPPTNMCYLSY